MGRSNNKKETAYQKLMDWANRYVPCNCPDQQCTCECFIWGYANIIKTGNGLEHHRTNRAFFARVNARQYDSIRHLAHVCGNPKCFRASHSHEPQDKEIFVPAMVDCIICGKTFKGPIRNKATMCSKRCKAKRARLMYPSQSTEANNKYQSEYRKRPENKVTRKCANCESDFQVYKKDKTINCGFTCGQLYRWKKSKEISD